MGTFYPCCRKEAKNYITSDLNLQPPITTETHPNKIRKITIGIKDISGLTTENNELTENIIRDGTFMKEFISILSSQQKSISVLQYQEDFLFDTVRINKLKNITGNGIPPILVLKIGLSEKENPKIINFGEIIEINALGFCGKVSSIRCKYDGYNFFGVVRGGKRQKRSSITQSPNNNFQNEFYKSNGLVDQNYRRFQSEENESPINDYNLPLNTDEYGGEQFIPSKRLFLIKYETETMKYHIKDLLSGVSTFYKVQNETVLLENSLINIGETYIFISFGSGDTDRPEVEYDEANNITKCPDENGMPLNNLINLKIFNKFGILVQDPINFQPSKSVIKIGRAELNEVSIKDNLISNTHCCLKYDRVVGWTIRDGFEAKQNLNHSTSTLHLNSTNGTWLYIGDDFTIADGMVFRCGSMILECALEGPLMNQNDV